MTGLRRRARRGPDGEARTDRQVGWLISLGGAALVLTQARDLMAHAEGAPWWITGGLILAAAGLCLAAFGRLLPMAVLRGCWVGMPVLGLSLWLTAFLAYDSGDVASVVRWTWALNPIVVSYLMLWLPLPGALATTALAAVLPSVSALLFVGYVPHEVVMAAPVLMSNIVYIVIFAGMRNRLGRLHHVEGLAREQHQRHEAEVAEAKRQERLGRLIHDEVLSVLAASMTFRGTPPPQLRAEAAHTLMLLDSSDHAPTHTESHMDIGEASATITAALRRIDPACRLRTDPMPGQVPYPVVSTMTQAAGEALRNAVRHAGTAGTSRWIDAHLSPDSVRIVVGDDGPGYDPSTVDPARLGVRESIVGRMSALPGGGARILSAGISGADAIGIGTQVVLTWVK